MNVKKAGAFSLYKVELRRLALSKFAWVAVILCICAPLLGYTMHLSNPAVLTGQYIANPVLAGTAYGALIWGLLTLLESNRVHRAGMGVLVDAVASPFAMATVRVAAVATLAAGTCFLIALVYLPYTIINVGSLFTFNLYIISFLVLLLPTWWVSILFASAIGQVAPRIQISGLLFAGFVLFGFSAFVSQNMFTSWLIPIVLTFSDGFSSLFYIRIAFYTRLIWLAFAGGLWVFSLLCIRRYQKNILGSFLRGIRKVYLPMGAVGLFAFGAFLWVNQPFVDHGPVEFYFGTPRSGLVYTEVSAVTYRLVPRTRTGQLHGVAEFTSASGSRGNYSMWLSYGYRIVSIEYDGHPADFTITSQVERDARRIDFTISRHGWRSLRIEYEGFPTMVRAFAPGSWGNEINTTNVTLSNASTIPLMDGFMLPHSFNLELTLPENMVPVANHRLLTDYTRQDNGTKLWEARIRDSRLRINAADYIVESFVAADMDVDFIFSRAYENIMREHNIPGSIAEVLDFFTEKLGPLHWAHLPSLSMLQSSALMFGGIAGDGFVEWGESIFTVSNLDNPLQGTSAAEVFVHEMVHMWWGGLGVFSGWGEDDNLWSDEGLTVYYTYRFFKSKYGETHARQHFVDAWQAAVDIQDRCFFSRNPDYFERLPANFRAQINSRNWGTNLYARMPLMILRAEELVGGPEIFDQLMRQVQEDFAGNGFMEPFTFRDFLDAVGLEEEDLRLG
ncbi:MAG: hypothetical protein FWE42_00515 [Defluviitaleaceae bacterium]|nr:hypothetical protein [Defluviitaleaceae bacterium]